MESRAHAFTAGLFVLVLGVATGLSLWWFGNDQEQGLRYQLVSDGNITGLNEQAQVRYRGIRAGKVEGIGINPADRRQILVRIVLRPNFPVTRGTRASLGYLGVTGIAYVQLSDKGDDPTPLPPGPDGVPRLPLQSGGLIDQLSDAGIETLRKVQAVAERLSQMLDDANVARFSRTLEHLESASEGVDRALKDVPATLAQLRAVLSAENIAHISQTLSQLDAASQEAAPVVRELRSLAVRLNGISERVDRLAASTDTGGTLHRVDSLLQELTETSRRASRLLEEVETSPQVLVFGRGQVAPGPGEAGFKSPGRKQ